MAQDPVMRNDADLYGDIAYMKKLAEEGRQAPVMVGPILVAAALWFGAATFIQWMVALGQIALGGWGVLALWVGAGLGFGALLYILIRRIGQTAGAQTRDNKAIGAAWSACGYTIFGMWLVFMAYGFSTQTWAIMSIMPSVVMVAYGAAWMIGAEVLKKSWMLLVGLISFAGAGALAWFAATHWTFGIYIALLVAVALLPGLHLMKLASIARNHSSAGL